MDQNRLNKVRTKKDIILIGLADKLVTDAASEKEPAGINIGN